MHSPQTTIQTVNRSRMTQWPLAPGCWENLTLGQVDLACSRSNGTSGARPIEAPIGIEEVIKVMEICFHSVPQSEAIFTSSKQNTRLTRLTRPYLRFGNDVQIHPRSEGPVFRSADQWWCLFALTFDQGAAYLLGVTPRKAPPSFADHNAHCQSYG